jgi:cell wall-associated NlpC family hydrolase
VASVGVLTLDIMPSVKDFSGDIQSQIIGPATQAGVRAGEGISSGILRGATEGSTGAGRAITSSITESGTRAGSEAGKVLQTQLGAAGARAGREAGTGITEGVVSATSRAGSDAGRTLSSSVASGGRTGGKEAGDAIGSAVGDGAKEGGSRAKTHLADGIHEGAKQGTARSKESMMSGFEGIAKGMAAMWAGSKAFDFFSESVQAAKDYNSTNRTVQATLQNVGAGAGVTTESFKKLSEANADLSGAGDTAQLSMQQTLLGFTNIKNSASDKIFDKTALAVNDLSAGMGIELPQAATTLGKAMDNPAQAATSLRKAHIDLSAAQQQSIKDMVKNGDTAGAQKVILQAVEDRYNGVAAASATTGARNSVAMERMKTDVGEKLLPAMGKWTKFMQSEVIPKLTAVIGFLGDHATEVGTLIGVLGGLYVAYKVYTAGVAIMTGIQTICTTVTELQEKGFGKLNSTMRANVIVTIVLLIAALILALIYAYNHCETFRNIVDKVWDVIKKVGAFIGDIFVAIWNALVDAFHKVVEAGKTVGEKLSGVMHVIADAASWMWDNVLKPVWDKLVAAFDWVVGAATDFGKGVAKGFNVIKDAAVWWWDHVLHPIFDAYAIAVAVLIAIVWVVFVKPMIWLFKDVLAPVFVWLWEHVIKPVFDKIGDIFNWIWNAIIFIVVGLIKKEIEILFGVFNFLWENVVKPVFNKIGDIFNWIWNAIIFVVVGLIKKEIQILCDIFNWLWDNVVRPVFSKIGDIFTWIHDTIIRPIVDKIKESIDGWGKIFHWLYDNVIKPVFDKIGEAANWFWDHVIHPVFDFISGKVHDVGQAFSDMGDTIGGIWDGLKKMVHDGIQAVVNLVWNNGLRPVVNAVLKWIPGMDELPRFDVPQFAGGGVLSGYAPGRDTVHALLSPGEAVLVPELVRMIGPAAILAANADAARHRYHGGGLVGHFADGGIVSGATGPAANASGAPMAGTAAGSAADLDATTKAATSADAAIQKLAASITGTLTPAEAALSALILAQVVPTLMLAELHVGTVLPQQNAALVTSTVASWMTITATITANDNAVTARQNALAQFLAASWAGITAVVSASTTAQLTAFGGLGNGLSGLRDAVGLTATWVHDRFADMQATASAPIRWILQNPFNAGLIAAWNSLDSSFALGKHLAPVAIPFATGGEVPGIGNTDTVRALLTPGEYVLPKPVVDKWGLDNVRAAHEAALVPGDWSGVEGMILGFADGGVVPATGSAQSAALARGIAYAQSMTGKPYVWGGSSTAGTDCSGYMGSIARVLLGLPPFPREWATGAVSASTPPPHFVPGIDGTFAIGVNPGSHTAGTLAGVNVESGGVHNNVQYGGNSAGADASQFPLKFHLPELGGSFVSGGGGSGFDPSAVATTAFADTYKMIGQITGLFGASMMASQGQGVATAGADAAKSAAISKITALVADTSAGSASSAGSADLVATVRGIAAGYGWNNGAEWDAIDYIVSHESSWDPTNQNKVSTAYGLFQFLDGTWGGTGVAKTSNPTQQAIAGMRYIHDRYTDPLGAKAFWDAHHSYDSGGIVPEGNTLVTNSSRRPEALLNGQQWDDIHALALARGRSGDAPNVTVNARTDASPEHIAAVVARRLQLALRVG